MAFIQITSNKNAYGFIIAGGVVRENSWKRKSIECNPGYVSRIII
jgi:hypothetical protein